MFNPISTWRKSSRTSKIVASAITLVMIPTLAFAAAFLLHLGVGGSVKSGKFNYTVSNFGLPTGTNSADVCASVSPNASNTGLVFSPGSGALPGDQCVESFKIIADTNTATGAVNGLTWTDLPTGWTASISPCGPTATIAAGASLPVTLTVSVGNNAVLDGSTHTFGTGDSLDVGLASQVTGTTACSVTGP